MDGSFLLGCVVGFFVACVLWSLVYAMHRAYSETDSRSRRGRPQPW